MEGREDRRIQIRAAGSFVGRLRPVDVIDAPPGRTVTLVSPTGLRIEGVIGTAKLHDIDPAAYVHAAIVAGDRGDLLLPEQFAARQ